MCIAWTRLQGFRVQGVLADAHAIANSLGKQVRARMQLLL